MSSYAEKLKDPRWQRVRLKIFERDCWRCRACGAEDKTLHVHHEAYRGEPWDAPEEALKTLCEDCHSKSHEPDMVLVSRSALNMDAATFRWIFQAEQQLVDSLNILQALLKASAIVDNAAVENQPRDIAPAAPSRKGERYKRVWAAVKERVRKERPLMSSNLDKTRLLRVDSNIAFVITPPDDHLTLDLLNTDNVKKYLETLLTAEYYSHGNETNPCIKIRFAMSKGNELGAR